MKQYLEDPRNFNQFYNPFTSFQSPTTNNISFQNDSSSTSSSSNSMNWLTSARPLESLYAAAALAAATATNTSTNTPIANTNSPALPTPNTNNTNSQFNLLANAGVNMNLNNSFLLSQLAASSSLGGLMSNPSMSMAALAAAAQQQSQQQQYLYHPYSNQMHQFQLQQNQQTKWWNMILFNI